MLNTANKELLKSLALKAGFGIIAVLADTLLASVSALEVSASIAFIIGLVAGEISQWAHTHYDLGGRVARAVVPARFRS